MSGTDMPWLWQCKYSIVRRSLHFAWVVDDAKCIVVTRVCVCLSVHGRTPTILHGPGCNLGAWQRLPLVVHYWADLQSGHGLRCYGNITRTLVTSLCPSAIWRHSANGRLGGACARRWPATGGRRGAPPKPRATYGKRVRTGRRRGRSQHYCGSLDCGLPLVAFWQQKANAKCYRVHAYTRCLPGFICYNFPWGCTEFPEFSRFREFPEYSKFPGLWPPCQMLSMRAQATTTAPWLSLAMGVADRLQTRYNHLFHLHGPCMWPSPCGRPIWDGNYSLHQCQSSIFHQLITLPSTTVPLVLLQLVSRLACCLMLLHFHCWPSSTGG